MLKFIFPIALFKGYNQEYYQYFSAMMDQLADDQLTKVTYKIYICLTIAMIVIITPIKSILHAFEYNETHQTFLNKLVQGPGDQSGQIQLTQLFPLLQRNPFRGKWESSIKRSEFFLEEEGLIEIKSKIINSDDRQSYTLFIRVFDGIYRQNCFYDIQIESKSLITKQRFEPGKIMYDSVSPMISYYRNGSAFRISQQQPIYINKIKIKANALFSENSLNVTPRGLELQLLVSTRNIEEYQQTFHDLLFSIFLIGTILVQMVGLYNIYDSIYTQRQYRQRFSKIGLLNATAIDFTLAMALSITCSQSEKKFAVYSLPAFLLWIMIILMQFRVLSHLNEYQTQEDPFKFNIKMYAYLGATCFFAYLCNLHPVFFYLCSIAVLLPQIWRNYVVGHKLKNNLQNYFMFALPRYLLYLKMYHFNVFNFQTKFLIGAMCMGILLIQVLLILAQMKYGVRAILPKFIHPSQFQYFMSQKEENETSCSICLLTLKEKSPESGDTTSLQSQDLYNMIVETPCHHKFHIQCLARWMETKLQCPNCRSIMPPIEDYQ